MHGEKMQHLKDADTKPVDSFNIITFSGEVMYWDNFKEGFNTQPAQFKPFPASEENKKPRY